jgi:hypothetical protein
MHAEEYQRTHETIAGVSLSLETYKIGSVYYCHVANLDPGATIARAQGVSRETAVEAALVKAKGRLT